MVAVDGSKHSEKVVDYGVSLAKAISAKIVLATVPPDLSVPEGYKQYVKEEGADPGATSRVCRKASFRLWVNALGSRRSRSKKYPVLAMSPTSS